MTPTQNDESRVADVSTPARKEATGRPLTERLDDDAVQDAAWQAWNNAQREGFKDRICLKVAIAAALEALSVQPHAEAGLKADAETRPVVQREGVCEICGGDCSSANPPMAYCPTRDDTKVIAESNGHHWIERFNLVCCRDCGFVRRADDKNKPCKGVVKVGLRVDADTRTRGEPSDPASGMVMVQRKLLEDIRADLFGNTQPYVTDAINDLLSAVPQASMPSMGEKDREEKM